MKKIYYQPFNKLSKNLKVLELSKLSDLEVTEQKLGSEDQQSWLARLQFSPEKNNFRKKDGFHSCCCCNAITSHRMMDHFMNEIIDVILQCPKMLFIWIYSSK